MIHEILEFLFVLLTCFFWVAVSGISFLAVTYFLVSAIAIGWGDEFK